MAEVCQGKMQTIIKSLEDLNDDLHAEILRRVPFQQLMWCKCVSKRWLFLISNPSFIGSHRFLSMEREFSWDWMYYSTEEKKLTPQSKDPLFNSQGFSFSFLPCYQPAEAVPINIVAAVNDLFLCCAANAEGINEEDIIVYYICNPLTMHWVALPATRRYSDAHHHLICESYEKQREGTTLCRFKVVRVILGLFSSRACVMDIFFSETRQWITRKVVLHPSKPFAPHPCVKTMTCNGTMYIVDGLGYKIMLFNLISVINNHCATLDSSHLHYHVFEIPKFESTVMACQGRLRAVALGIIRGVPFLDISELKEDCSLHKGDSEWSLVHRVPFRKMVALTNKEWFIDILKRGLPHPNGIGTCRFKALDFQPGNENIVYLSLYGRMASYDMCNKVLTFHPETKSSSICKVVLPLQPTLIPML